MDRREIFKEIRGKIFLFVADFFTPKKPRQIRDTLLFARFCQ